MKFTLVDFMIKIKDPYFILFDLLECFLNQIENDREKMAHEKTINLVSSIHKNLIDSYASHNHARAQSKFLMWLFVRLIQQMLNFVDKFVEEGVDLDCKHELGFKKNTSILNDNAEFWRTSYQVIIGEHQQIPFFLQIILASSYKICKHMDVIKLIGEYNENAYVYENFLRHFAAYCPYLIREQQDEEADSIELRNDRIVESKKSILQISFDQINTIQFKKKPKVNRNKLRLIRVEELFKNENTEKEVICFNLEKAIEETLSESFIHYVQSCSHILIEKLMSKFNMFKFFEFLHSYYLFRSNEIMFIFAKKLFDLIKSYETYQDEAILNNLFYNSSYSVFTTAILTQISTFNFNLIKISYCQQEKQAATSNMGTFESSRLVDSIQLKINITWPLNIILKQSDLDTYNKIFIFLLQIKQVKYDLDSLYIKGFNLHHFLIDYTHTF
jgi:hypothetical protein